MHSEGTGCPSHYRQERTGPCAHILDVRNNTTGRAIKTDFYYLVYQIAMLLHRSIDRHADGGGREMVATLNRR